MEKAAALAVFESLSSAIRLDVFRLPTRAERDLRTWLGEPDPLTQAQLS